MNRQKASQTLIPAFILALTLITCIALIPCFADTIHYRYDDLNRLIRTENAATGTIVEYRYDALGNRLQKQITSQIGLAVTVRKDAEAPLQGVRTYLFREGGGYLGLTQVSGATGGVAFDVPRGSYQVRADYLGYSFWSTVVEVTGATVIDLTIAHHPVSIAVNSVYQGASTPLSGIKVYLFSPANAYLGVSQQTGADGRVSFSLPGRDYKVRADYLGQQYFSALFNQTDAAVTIPLAEAVVTVLQAGQAVGGVNVYAFSPSGSYLGITAKTDAFGKVTFRLPEASYKFRADYLGSQYWTAVEPLVADQSRPIALNTGGGAFRLTLLKGASEPLAGVPCYAFTEGGSYLGLSGKTAADGRIVYNLSDGRYKFRLDYLGYSHWTDVVTVPAAMDLTRVIDHRAVAITVTGALAGDHQARSGVPVYLFTPSGAYLSLHGATDDSGRVSFDLPQSPYKVRADYLGRQFWSEGFTWEDRAVTIPEGTGRVHVTLMGQDLPNVRVYVFTTGDAYLGVSGTTDVSGNVDFRLPAGTYKFRADYQGAQYWAAADLEADLVNPAELSTGGGAFALTIDRGPEPLTAVRTYAFTSGGSYLGLSGTSDTAGRVSFPLADGSYKFRADYLGYPFWSDLYAVPGTLSGTLSIPHGSVTIRVEGVYQGSWPLAGVNVYLFTPAGSYLGKKEVTDGYGRVAFSLPGKGYRVRADYLGYSFWSDEFQLQDAAVSIPRGMAQIAAVKGGSPASGARVYLFSGSGSYLGLNATTDAAGRAEFLLPDRAYKFRVDEGGTQHWSAVTTITAGQVNPVEVTW
jgi:YD repeat-containing protein